MQIFFYPVIGLLMVALAAALWLLSNARKKLVATEREMGALKTEIGSANWKIDKIGTVFSALEEEANDRIRGLSDRNVELERLLEKHGPADWRQ